MAPLKHSWPSQCGHTLVQTLVGMALSLWVVAGALAAFAALQAGHHQLQTQADAHERLRSSLQLLRERVQRSGAPELVLDSKGKAALAWLPDGLQGSNNGLTLEHARSLTPADCQGHEASDWSWLMDDFMLNTRLELVCKDSWRDNSTYQSLVDGVAAVQFLYAEQLSANPIMMQWRSADQVSDWAAVQGVTSCLQVQETAATPWPSSAPCATGVRGLAWRGVSVLRHHPP